MKKKRRLYKVAAICMLIALFSGVILSIVIAVMQFNQVQEYKNNTTTTTTTNESQ